MTPSRAPRTRSVLQSKIARERILGKYHRTSRSTALKSTYDFDYTRPGRERRQKRNARLLARRSALEVIGNIDCTKVARIVIRNPSESLDTTMKVTVENVWSFE